ncbi:hypothetical protein PI125_g19460 [Phytophthora idaei]|nr:hypothetical protein PI125_g19460 [Phytophthora idaei]
MKQKREPEDDASRPLAQSSEEKSLFSFKRRRQKEINERRRLLRNAGVYGNSNRVRNERTREIAVLIGETAARPEVRKRRRRDEVERDNVRLRNDRWQIAFKTQCRNKLVSQLTNEYTSLVGTYCPKRMLSPCSTSVVIQKLRDLFGRLDASYRDVNSVFAANGLAAMTISPTAVHVREGWRQVS